MVSQVCNLDVSVCVCVSSFSRGFNQDKKQEANIIYSCRRMTFECLYTVRQIEMQYNGLTKCHRKVV